MAEFTSVVDAVNCAVENQRELATNRGHWSIENSCHYSIDWNYDEDRSRIRKGHGAENITRLWRFAITIIKSKGVRSVPQRMRQLMRNVCE